MTDGNKFLRKGLCQLLIYETVSLQFEINWIRRGTQEFIYCGYIITQQQTIINTFSSITEKFGWLLLKFWGLMH
jgi:hypothetical protein